MEYPTQFNLHGIESIAGRMESKMRCGMTPSGEETRKALTALRTLLTARAQAESRAEKKKKVEMEEARSKHWQVKLEEFICEGQPILV
jgi:hypothetical protein